MKKKTALIIGGGPAGLTAAYEFLKNSDVKPIVIEMSDYWGGISRTVDYKGNKIDIGGHRFFSKSDEIMEWWKHILPVHSEYKTVNISYQNKSKVIETNSNTVAENDKILLVRKRKSRIFYEKKFFDYPISLSPSTIKKLGYYNTFLIGLSYMKSVFFPLKNEQTLEHFFINRFGKRLYLKFFKDYTEKVWGLPCNQISSEWGAQRIKGLSITKTITHYFKKLVSVKSIDINQKNTETSLIEYFLYPKFGPGQMWEEVAKIVSDEGGTLYKNSKVIAINVEKNTIKSIVVKNIITNAIQEIECDYCLSTMPIKELINSIDTQIPDNVKEVAAGLCYRDFITVGLLLKKLNYEVEDNWIYIQEPNVKVGRLQVFNNWSPYLVADAATFWVGLEYFCDEGDDFWKMTDEAIREIAIREMIDMGFIDSSDFLDGVVIRMPKTYPAYFGTYNRLDEVKQFTETFENLFLIGRNGMHKYNNQDHSMLTAIQTVRNIVNNQTNKDNIWQINTEQEYHENK